VGLPELLAGLPPSHAIAESASYFTALSATPGTGLATIAALTTESDTSPFIQINAGAKAVFLDYLLLTVTAPGTAGTSLRFSMRTDVAKAAPTGGSQLVLSYTRRVANLPAPSLSVWAGALVAAAAGTPLRHCSRLVRPVIPVIGDQYLIKFGGIDFGVISLLESGTAIADRYVAAPPMIVDPAFTGQIHIWLPGQSAASSYEVELGGWEF
jgi:hypothetical protein